MIDPLNPEWTHELVEQLETDLRSAAKSGELPLGEAFDCVKVANALRWLRERSGT